MTRALASTALKFCYSGKRASKVEDSRGYLLVAVFMWKI